MHLTLGVCRLIRALDRQERYWQLYLALRDQACRSTIKPYSTGTTQPVSGLPQRVTELLKGTAMAVNKLEDSGRGLIATQAIERGSLVYEEQPLVCHPVPEQADKVCYHCLQVFGLSGKQPLRAGRHKFCSESCLIGAERLYLDVEQEGFFAKLDRHCVQTAERFPLLAKRLACTALQQAVSGRSSSDIQDLEFLAFANAPRPPPEPWVASYNLLAEGVEGYAQSLAAEEAAAGKAAAAQLSLRWYIGVLSRLHINSVRVDCVLPWGPGSGLSPQSVAAAMVGGDGSGYSGSAVYLAASLFNHSCVPNVDLHFPRNNGVATFTAARDILAGEQLCITYVDLMLPTEKRRAQLHWGYGFHCGCERCLEEQ